MAGQTYTISFIFEPDDYFELFKVSFGTDVLLDISEADNTSTQTYTFLRTAAGAKTRLQFDFQDIDNFVSLDAVSVTVPEPAPLALFGIGLAGAWLVRRRGTKATA